MKNVWKADLVGLIGTFTPFLEFKRETAHAGHSVLSSTGCRLHLKRLSETLVCSGPFVSSFWSFSLWFDGTFLRECHNINQHNQHLQALFCVHTKFVLRLFIFIKEELFHYRSWRGIFYEGDVYHCAAPCEVSPSEYNLFFLFLYVAGSWFSNFLQNSCDQVESVFWINWWWVIDFSLTSE